MRLEKIKNFLNEQKILLVILVVVIFLYFSSDYFLTFQNIINIFQTISFEGMIVIGMALLIIIGEIDLSVGSIMAFGSALAVLVQPYGIIPAIIAGVLGGTLIGFINGIITTKLKLPSIEVTLGTMVLLTGVVFALTGEHTITGSNPNFVIISQTTIFKIPLTVFVFILLLVIFEILLQRSVFGRHIFAIGGNSTASKFFGIKVDSIRVAVFVITGFLSGLAGVMLAGKLNIASGNIGGGSTAVFVITAVLLGGISMEGGEGNIFKAFQGILLLGIMNNAMVLLKISPFIQQIIRGLLLILIVVIDAINIQRKKYL